MKKSGTVAFGIDLNSRKVGCVLVSPGGDIIGKQSIYAEVYRGEEYIVGKITDAMASMLKKAGADRETVIGTGIAVPTVRNGFSKAPLHFEGWNLDEIAERLQDTSGHMTFLLNYGTATGFSEALAHTGREERILSIDVFETLMSAGFIAGGRIVPGCENMNIGHMVIDPAGFACSCGSKGCLEAMATAGGVLNYYKAFSKQRTSFAKWKKDIKTGDIASMYTLDKCAASLAAGIRNVLRLLEPDIVILGGDMILGVPELYEKTVSLIREKEKDLPMIKKASCNGSSEAYGAAAYVLLNR